MNRHDSRSRFGIHKAYRPACHRYAGSESMPEWQAPPTRSAIAEETLRSALAQNLQLKVRIPKIWAVPVVAPAQTILSKDHLTCHIIAVNPNNRITLTCFTEHGINLGTDSIHLIDKRHRDQMSRVSDSHYIEMPGSRAAFNCREDHIIFHPRRIENAKILRDCPKVNTAKTDSARNHRCKVKFPIAARHRGAENETRITPRLEAAGHHTRKWAGARIALRRSPVSDSNRDRECNASQPPHAK